MDLITKGRITAVDERIDKNGKEKIFITIVEDKYVREPEKNDVFVKTELSCCYSTDFSSLLQLKKRLELMNNAERVKSLALFAFGLSDADFHNFTKIAEAEIEAKNIQLEAADE